MDRPDYGIISGAHNVKSSSFAINLEKSNIFGNDSFAISLSQPNRVESGSMDIKTTNLSDSEGNLTYSNKRVSIEPTGRQKDFGVAYSKSINNDVSITSKVIGTKELNHVKSAEDTVSGFLGMKYNNLRFGTSVATNRKGFDFGLNYSINF